MINVIENLKESIKKFTLELNKEILNHRLGRVKVSKELLITMDLSGRKSLFGQFFPTHIDNTSEKDVVIYTGTCEKFDLVQDGEMIPYYDFIFRRSEDGTAEVVNISKIHVPAVPFFKKYTLPYITKDIFYDESGKPAYWTSSDSWGCFPWSSGRYND